ncbi:hypothetical protein GC197_04395 [bacterium]|nr:hypothetical protein [bacterium]
MFRQLTFCTLGLLAAILAGCSNSTPDIPNIDRSAMSNADGPSKVNIAEAEMNEPTATETIVQANSQSPTAEDPELLKKFTEKGWIIRRTFLIDTGEPIIQFDPNGKLADEDYDEIVKSKTISFLDLMGINEANDQILGKLPQLTSLKRVLLGGDTITDEGLSALATCPNLNSVILVSRSKEITDKGIAALAGSKNLKILRISYFPSDGQCFAAFEEHPKLSWLEIEEAINLTDAGAEHIAKIPHLEQLVIKTESLFGPSNPKVTRQGIAAIVNGNMPKKFRAPPELIDDDLFVAMLEKGWTPPQINDPPANPKELKRLNLKHYNITDKGFLAALERFKLLTSVELGGDLHISTKALGQIADSSITDLSLQESELTEDQFKLLGNCKNVTHLSLYKSKFDPTWLQHLQNLPDLEELDLSFSVFDDSGAEFVAKLQNLKNLNARFTELTDQGLEIVAKAPKLEKLDAWGAKVTDEGKDRVKAENPGMSIN